MPPLFGENYGVKYRNSPSNGGIFRGSAGVRSRGYAVDRGLVHGAAGGVGSIAVQLAHEVGAVVIGTGRAADRDTVLGLGAHAFLDLETTSSKTSVKLTWSSM